MLITRDALYEKVWELPLGRVAAEFGITRAAISHLCRTYSVPTPPIGYWTKREMGKPVERQELGPAADGFDGPIVIAPPPSRTSAVRPLDALHPWVVETQRALAENPPTAGIADCSGDGVFSVRVTQANIDRAVRLLDWLARMAELQEWKVTADGPRRLVIEGEPVGIEVREKLDRVPHVLTSTDRKALAEHARAKPRRGQPGHHVHLLMTPKIPRWDWVPSGRLELRIEGRRGADGLRHTFSDAANQRLEDMLPGAIRSLKALGASRRRLRSRVNPSAVERQAAVQEENAKEFRRRDLLEALMTRLETARRIEAFVSALRASHADVDEAVTAFAAWAEGYAAELRRGTMASAVGRALRRQRLHDDPSR